MFNRNQGIATQLARPFIGLVVLALLLAACGSQSALAPTPAPTQPPPTATPEPATPTPEPATPTPEPATPTPEPATPTPEPATPTPEPATPTPEPATPTPEPTSATSSSSGQSGEITWVDEVFPPGHEKERDLMLYTCGSCHVWVCAVIGQRTAEYWGTVHANHMDLVSGLSEEDGQLLFDFLAENFNDTKPEPEVPEELRSLGCTGQ